MFYGRYRTLFIIIWYIFLFSSQVEKFALLRTHWCDVVHSYFSFLFMGFLFSVLQSPVLLGVRLQLWTVSHETHSFHNYYIRAQSLSLIRTFLLEVKNSYKNISKRQEQTIDQTNLIRFCEPRGNCDNRNISSACNTKSDISTANGGSFYLKYQQPELSRTQRWSFSMPAKFQ
jgi:hypothetical protein